MWTVQDGLDERVELRGELAALSCEIRIRHAGVVLRGPLAAICAVTSTCALASEKLSSNAIVAASRRRTSSASHVIASSYTPIRDVSRPGKCHHATVNRSENFASRPVFGAAILHTRSVTRADRIWIDWIVLGKTPFVSRMFRAASMRRA